MTPSQNCQKSKLHRCKDEYRVGNIVRDDDKFVFTMWPRKKINLYNPSVEDIVLKFFFRLATCSCHKRCVAQKIKKGCTKKNRIKVMHF